jgi:hypothetical protein
MLKVTERPTERIVRGAAGALLLIFASFVQGPYDFFQIIFGISLLVCGGMSLVTGLVGASFLTACWTAHVLTFGPRYTKLQLIEPAKFGDAGCSRYLRRSK